MYSVRISMCPKPFFGFRPSLIIIPIYLIYPHIGDKEDSVAFVIRKGIFDILGTENIYLCNHGDRVALLVWLKHKYSKKHIIIANTHLSFPHSIFDKMNQVSVYMCIYVYTIVSVCICAAYCIC